MSRFFRQCLLAAALFAAATLPAALHAQENSAAAAAAPTVPIALSLYATEMGSDLTETQTALAGRKITLLLDRYGYVAHEGVHNFGVYPKFAVLEENVMEGLSKMLVVKADFSLVAKQVSNGIVVATCSQTVTGSGSTRAAALTNAVSNLPMQGAQYQAFFKTMQQKIAAYYQQNCASIIAEANAASTRQQYALALNLLGQVPREAGDCFAQAQAQMLPVYQAFQKDRCARMVQAAQAEVAAMRYQSALSILSVVDPNSPCRADALAMIQKTGTQVEAQYREQWAFLQKAYSDEVVLEKLRIEAWKEIGKAYYGKSDNVLNALIVK